MPYIAIEGAFRAVGFSPDPDTIRFGANDPSTWNLIKRGPKPDLNKEGLASLRFIAIDGEETHFLGEHQPLKWANKGRDRMLYHAGFRGVKFDDRGRVAEVKKDGLPGFILSRVVEGYQRPVSFVIPGKAVADLGLVNGAEVFVTPEHVQQSINYTLAVEGLVYPTYYTGLFSDLRDVFVQAIASAKSHNRGLWPDDKTNTGFELNGLSSITTDHDIMPKIFRRLVAFLDTEQPIKDFVKYLEANDDPVWIISKTHLTKLHNLIEVNGNRIRLTEDPNNLVFVEKKRFG